MPVNIKRNITIFFTLFFCIILPVSAIPDDFIPQYALDYAEQFKKKFLQDNSQSASDLQYRFFYNNNGEACLEYTVTPKGRYTWPTPTWVGYTWGSSFGTIGLNAVHYTKTKQLSDAAEYRMEERRKDPVFKEIERIVLQIATEYDYDFQSLGVQAKNRNANTKRAVCEGYSNAVTAAFKNHPLIANVETWSSAAGNHAWNVIVLNDERKIYCDATWYDGNSIDSQGYVVTIPERDPVNLTYDINEFNTLGGAVNRSNGRQLQVRFAWPDAVMK